ncbi:hypothetical protein GCM10022244_29280 [Streptomyces gulbargensis]|uniref:Uncharacterized protein n=1 Tax=Streptomyces gulbargensis TaxID=364901 RepID=A0ABP7MB72_9ACTN
MASLFIGVVIGLLTYAVMHSIPGAVLAGLGAAGASFRGLPEVIGR